MVALECLTVKAGREIKKVEREKAKREKRKKKDYFEVDDDNDGL